MHRKLIHSVRALGVALSLLTAGLILAIPAPAPGRLSADPEATTAAATEIIQADTASTSNAYRRHRRAQARDAMALPFFSFAQGLRRSNRS